jgi:hypothetical protein
MIFLRQPLFIHHLIRIFLGKLHHHTSRRSDYLSSQKNVLQSERLDLLTVIRHLYNVNLEHQEKIESQHHQLKIASLAQKDWSKRCAGPILVGLVRWI